MVFANKPVFIIAGEKKSGKTSFLLHLLHMFSDANLLAAGFVSLHRFADDSYAIRNIQTGEEVRLMQRIATFENRPHHFTIYPEGEKAGLQWIQMLVNNPPQLAVIDEIGSYELLGKLWWEGFSELVNAPVSLIFTTKTKHVKAIMERWNIEPSAIFYPEDFNHPEKAFNHMKSIMQASHKDF